jgi:hypothetical protein
MPKPLSSPPPLGARDPPAAPSSCATMDPCCSVALAWKPRATQRLNSSCHGQGVGPWAMQQLNSSGRVGRGGTGQGETGQDGVVQGRARWQPAGMDRAARADEGA